MPSTRGVKLDYGDGLPDDFSDEEFDPDYRESSADEDAVDDLPMTMHRDRAEWVLENREDLEWLWINFLDLGRSQMGNAFMQKCDSTMFSYFVYRNTTPFSEP